LQQLPPVAESWPGIPSLAAMEEQFKRPWINKPLGYTRYIRPANNMPDYWVKMATNDGALVLNLNHTNQQKEMLLIYYTQLGIDLYGRMRLAAKETVLMGVFIREFYCQSWLQARH
jgi:hypothetical protein